MVRFSKNLYRLKTLFTTPEAYKHPESCVWDFDQHKKAKILATLLAHAELATPILNQQGVTSLLKGENRWPKDDGTWVDISVDIPIEVFVRLGVLSFTLDYCQTHFSPVRRDTPVLQGTQLSIFSALENLRNIQSGQQGFIKSYFQISKKEATSLVESFAAISDLESLNEIKPCAEKYCIVLDHGEIGKLISDYLWPEWCAANDVSAFRKLALIARVYDNSYLLHPNLHNFDEKHQEAFLDQAVTFIENDSQLKQSHSVLENQWRSDAQFEHHVSQETIDQLLINKSIAPDNVLPFSSHTIDEPLCETQNATATSYLRLAQSWHTQSTSNLYSRGIFNNYFGLVGFIARQDIIIEVDTITDTGQLEKLISHSADSAELQHILFNVLPSFSNPTDYLLYLLSRTDTSAVAVYCIIHTLPHYIELYGIPHTSNEYFNTVCFPVVCDTFFSTVFEPEASDQLESIVELLTALAKECIHASTESAQVPDITKSCLDHLLNRFSLNQLEGFVQKLLSAVIADTTARPHQQAAWKMYLLFWLLEKTQVAGLSVEAGFSEKLQVAIVATYKQAFDHCIASETDSIDANSMIDQLAWHRFKSNQAIDKLLNVLGNPVKWTRKHLYTENVFNYNNLNVVKSYFQILLCLSDNQARIHNNKIQRQILSLVNQCGYIDKQYSHGLFYGLTQYPRTYPLWCRFCQWVEVLDDEEFNGLLDNHGDDISTGQLLELYQQTSRENRKATVLRLIDAKSDEDEQQGILSIQKTLELACLTRQVALARTLLQKGLAMLNDTSSTLHQFKNSHFYRDMQKVWSKYEYFVTLLRLADRNDLTVDDIEKSLCEIENPFATAVNNGHLDRTHYRECEQYKQAILANTLFESSPDRSYELYDSLYRSSGNIRDAGQRFAAQLAVTEQSTNEVSDGYQTALSAWLAAITDCNVQQLDTTFVQNWFHCLLQLKQHIAIDKIWLDASHQQQNNIGIATCYCQSLMGRGQKHSAKIIFDKLKNYHNREHLSEEAEKEIDKLNQLILSDLKIESAIAVSKQLVDQPKSDNELRRAHQEIYAKTTLSEIVRITEGSDTSVEVYLYQGLLAIAKEIQLRKKNLQIHDDTSKKISTKITKEDLINDWVTSLFDHQYKHIGLNCRDQKRAGKSASAKNPGEIDFYICDKWSNRISIMEAFILKSNTQDTIKNHLNKIEGYDQECLSPVFILVYCDTKNFEDLCHKYQSTVSNFDYTGFTADKSDTLEFKEDTSTIKTFKQIRHRGGKSITIYHFMLNLHFDG